MINILLVYPFLGLGGSEKVVVTLAKHLDKSIFNVAICVFEAGGAREKTAREIGIKLYCVDKSPEKFAELIKNKKIHVVHFFGLARRYAAFVETAAGSDALVTILMDNAGKLAPDASKSIELHLISKMLALRYKKQHRMSNDDFNRDCRVFYVPIDMGEAQRAKMSGDEIAHERRKLGIAPDDLIIGRISRADVGKWGNICIDMMPHLIKKIPNVKYLVMGVPEAIRERIKRKGLNEYFIFLESDPSDESVMKFFQLIDIFAYSSKVGESFGQTIAEAMKSDKPVVVESTPLVDNAQVEQVDNGKTGFIVYSPEAFADAITYLASHRGLIKEMGLAGYAKVDREWEAGKTTCRIEKRVLELLRAKGLEIPSKTLERYEKIRYLPSTEEVDDFEREYERRLKDCFGKPNLTNIFIGKHVVFSPLMQKLVRTSRLTNLRNAVMGIRR